MDLSQNSISSNSSNSFGLQTNFLNKKPAGLNFGMKINNNNNSGFYAKKGEPMYMKEMDLDEDGVVSFDEFKEYCEENGISPKEMMKMVQLASSYRTMQAQKKAEKEVKENSSDDKNTIKEVESEAVYAKRGDGKYDEAMDTNNDDKVSYKEYIEYCKEHSQPQEQKSGTRVSESEDGEFKTTSTGKAINSYTQSETESAENFVDEEG